MKKYYLIGTALIGLSLLVSSCQEENIDEINTENENYIDPEYLKGNVYPLSEAYRKMRPQTRATGSFDTDWENCQEILLASGKPKSLPWATTSDGNVPYDLACDIKKNDGWQLIYHTFASSPDAQEDRNYMIFHNLRTGILKIFYYKESNPDKNNFCVWSLKFEYPQQLLNGAEEIAHPVSFGRNNVVEATTLSESDNKSFKIGWNCFQTQLTYSPNSPTQVISIGANTLNLQDINLFGEYSSVTGGTILYQSSTNPASNFTGKIASISGDYAKNWVQQQIDGGKIKAKDPQSRSVIGSLVASGVGAMIKGGVNKILNKFTGRFRKTQTNKLDVHLETNGKMTAQGTISFSSAAPVLSLRTDFSKTRVGELGAWNLTEQPTIYLNPLAAYEPHDMDENYKQYTYRYKGIRGYKYNLIFNPQLTPYLVKHWVDISVVHYRDKKPEIPAVYTDFGSMGGVNHSPVSSYYNELLYESKADNISIYEDNFDADVYTTMSMYTKFGRPLKYAFIPKLETMESYSGPLQFDKNHYLKFTLYMVTQINGQQDTTVSTRTYIPKIEWDPTLYNQFKNMDELTVEHWGASY